MKEYLKYIIPGAIGLIVITILIFLGNSFSCITIPKKIDGLSIQCQYSIDLSVLAVQSKNPVSQVNSTDAIRACLAEFRYTDCKSQRDKYAKDHSSDPDQSLANERANFIYTVCESARKPG